MLFTQTLFRLLFFVFITAERESEKGVFGFNFHFSLSECAAEKVINFAAVRVLSPHISVEEEKKYGRI